MGIMLLTGSAYEVFADTVADRLGVSLGRREVEIFPDGEQRVEIQESVRGEDVYLLQPTSPLAEKYLLWSCSLLADASNRAGAARVTAVIPYFGYARQDRRASSREPVGARLIASFLESGGLLRRVVAIDVHAKTIEGFFGIPLEHLSAVPRLVEALYSYADPDSVIVAPDTGAAKLAVIHKAHAPAFGGERGEGNR